MSPEKPPFRVVSIHGAPRSGTSWLGQIFNSHPDVAYRYQPLFSYRFKGAVSESSSREEIKHFLNELYSVTDDEFLLQEKQRLRGVHPSELIKSPHPSVLVMKEVRYHYVIETLLREVPNIRVIGIVRHPCGTINSWLKTPREFKPQWNASTEWRNAPSKNQGRGEEYYGFEKWKELARLFLRLEKEWPQAFHLVRYEKLVNAPEAETAKLFAFCGLDLDPQVCRFLAASRSREVEDPDTVFRTADVANRWKAELDPAIRDAILHDVEGSDLSIFLE